MLRILSFCLVIYVFQSAVALKMCVAQDYSVNFPIIYLSYIDDLDKDDFYSKVVMKFSATCISSCPPASVEDLSAKIDIKPNGADLGTPWTTLIETGSFQSRSGFTFEITTPIRGDFPPDEYDLRFELYYTPTDSLLKRLDGSVFTSASSFLNRVKVESESWEALVSIDDLEIRRIRDDDGDGYYSLVELAFDPEVSADEEIVAMLYSTISSPSNPTSPVYFWQQESYEYIFSFEGEGSSDRQAVVYDFELCRQIECAFTYVETDVYKIELLITEIGNDRVLFEESIQGERFEQFNLDVVGVGIENSEEISGNGLNAWPNPIISRATVRYGMDIQGHIELNLVDIQGKRVRSLFSGRAPSGMNEFIFNVDHLAAGAYFIMMQSDHQTHILPVIVSN